ncbi:MAG: hypothetical protein ACFFEV_09300, partial [Candidatus Thorarchaeota archaeon]
MNDNLPPEALDTNRTYVSKANSVTYDNHRIFLGTLADGQQVEVLDPFSFPEEMVSFEPGADEVVWILE